MTRMANNFFSKQEVIKLLSQIRMIRAEYPLDLLTARRRLYLGMAAQIAATRASVDNKWKQWISSIVREPSSTVIKALVVFFVVFLIAFVVHSLATGNLAFRWIIELISY